MEPMSKRFNLAGQMPLISLIVLCAVTALLTNRFLSPLNLTNILVQSSIMAVIAMGMTFVIVGGGFDLSVGSTAALSGCIAAMVMLEAGIAAGVVAGIAAGAGVGLANGLVIAFLNVNPFITTLGTMVLVRGIVFLITGGAPVSGETGLLRRLRRLRLRPPPRHPLSGLGAGTPPGRAVLRHACHAVWPASLRHRRRAGGRVPVGRAGAPGDRLDLRLVRRARRRRRGDARRPVAVGPADRRRVLRIDRHRGRGAGWGRAPGRRRHALQERDRGLHHDRARQRAQSAQRRFLLAARGGGRGDHCGGRRREATLAPLKRSIPM